MTEFVTSSYFPSTANVGQVLLAFESHVLFTLELTKIPRYTDTRWK